MATVINAPIKAHGTVTYPKLRVVLDSLQFTLDSLITTGLGNSSFALTSATGAITTSANFTYTGATAQIGASGSSGSVNLYYNAETRYLQFSTETAASLGFIAYAPRLTVSTSSVGGVYLEAQNTNNTIAGVILSDSGRTTSWNMDFLRSTSSGLDFKYTNNSKITFSTGGVISTVATTNQLVLGTTRTVTLTAPTPASSSRVVTIPDLSADYSVVGTEAAQTINGSKTFSAQIVSTATSNHLKLATASNNAIISVASIATADRTITIPDPGGAANFVLSEAAATINGTKTFGSVVLFANGTVSAPNGFSGDTNNGFYYIGTDNWALAAAGAKVWETSAAGGITQPLQPSFLVTMAATRTNVTGDGTAYTLALDTEIFDQGGNFASNTFTAPVTGRYILSISTYVFGQSALSDANLKIVTSNRTYYAEQFGNTFGTQGITFKGLVLADMDANDTVTCVVTMSGGTKVADVLHSDAGGTATYFSGSLIN